MTRARAERAALVSTKALSAIGAIPAISRQEVSHDRLFDGAIFGPLPFLLRFELPVHDVFREHASQRPVVLWGNKRDLHVAIDQPLDRLPARPNPQAIADLLGDDHLALRSYFTTLSVKLESWG